MAFSSTLVFSVKRRKPELVIPAKPTPREIKKLSDIDDQEGLRFQMPIMFFYRDNPSMRGKDPFGVIREGLAKTLVYYYPFAGRIIEGDNRKLMVDCNEEGVLFVEADANISMEQLGDNVLPPCPFMEEFLHDVPGSEGIIGCPLLLIQVTRFICGGFAMGIRFNHTMADAYGMIQLLTAFTEFVKGASTPSILPVWQREQYFTARSPPRITCTHNEYEQTPHDISYADIMDSEKLIRTAIFFSPNDIQALHNHMSLSGNFNRCSRFELITAYLWKCRTIALSPADPDEVVRLSAITTARGKPGLNIPTRYYGNSFTFPAAVSTAGILCTSPLSYAVHLIQKAKAQLTEEYIKSVADLMVIKKRPKFTTIWNLIVSDITRIGFDKVDFGWGDPEFGGIPFATSNISVCMNFKNWKGEDVVVVSICLPPLAVHKFKYELKKMACYSIICRM
ncbi:methanol O-anthraniloyltransferase [Olea europaea subsp. europaea]|uniref:Methanol O-anthraniloyltransferase n=1 Tax=Olea europaea subsp. europaea TaxID=158383 RepID=A0A8S0RHY7_OLEEU|nr:methanol O-anthraniloyltransferase [Olea europaea subsp. europaea]